MFSLIVREGGSAFLITEFGPSFHHDAYAFFLDRFGIQHENNKIIDPTNSATEEFWDFYERDRNFECHPIVRFLDKIQFRAAATLTDGSSQTVIHTDSDSAPAGRPVLLARRFGKGLLVVVGDSSWLSLHIEEHHHKALALAVVDWLSMRL